MNAIPIMVVFRTPSSITAGNYINAAAAVGADAADLDRTTRLTSPDYQKISKEAIDSYSLIQREAMNRVGGKGILGVKQQLEQEIIKKDIAEREQRMAGIVAAAGQRTKDYLALIHKKDPIEPKPYDLSKLYNVLRQQGDFIEGLQEQNRNKKIEPLTIPDLVTSAGISSTSQPLSGSENEIAKTMYNYMVDEKGVTPTHAKGILANIKGESGFRTDAIGDSGESGGLFQMNKGRFTKMINNVPDWKTNWKGQIDNALTDDTAPQYLKTDFGGDSVAAANWFLENFERPAEEHRPGRRVLNEQFIGNLGF